MKLGLPADIMSSSETTDRGQAYRRLAIWLVGGHVVLLVLLGVATRLLVDRGSESPVFATFVGLAFAQANLIGMWLTLADRLPIIRLVATAASVYCISLVLQAGTQEPDSGIIILIAGSTAVVAVLLTVTRLLGVNLVQEREPVVPRAPLQFSVRQLLLLTLAVACLLGVSRWLLPSITIAGWAILIVIAGPFAIFGVVAAWAMLGTKQLRVALIILSTFALIATVVQAWLHHFGIAFWTIAVITNALTLALTLGVLRARGIRLRRRRA